MVVDGLGAQALNDALAILLEQVIQRDDGAVAGFIGDVVMPADPSQIELLLSGHGAGEAILVVAGNDLDVHGDVGQSLVQLLVKERKDFRLVGLSAGAENPDVHLNRLVVGRGGEAHGAQRHGQRESQNQSEELFHVGSPPINIYATHCCANTVRGWGFDQPLTAPIVRP